MISLWFVCDIIHKIMHDRCGTWDQICEMIEMIWSNGLDERAHTISCSSNSILSICFTSWQFFRLPSWARPGLIISGPGLYLKTWQFYLTRKVIELINLGKSNWVFSVVFGLTHWLVWLGDPSSRVFSLVEMDLKTSAWNFLCTTY